MGYQMPDRRSVVQVKFRLRRDLLRRVEKEAKAEDRSVNEQLERIVERGLDARDITQVVWKAMKGAPGVVVSPRGDPPAVEIIQESREEGDKP